MKITPKTEVLHGGMVATPEEFYEAASLAWEAAENGRAAEAYELYRKAESLVDYGMNYPALLNMARHYPLENGTRSLIEGLSIPFESNEDFVIGIEANGGVLESKTVRGLKMIEYTHKSLVRNIKRYKVDLEYHPQNLPQHLPHLFVMSTGRCGTTSLYHDLKNTHVAYHQHFVFPSHFQRLEQMCYMIDGVQNDSIAKLWLRFRAAEWLGASMLGVPMANLNHLDTIFAPVFALMHPKAEFIYLRRNPRDTFASFYGKKQFNRQLMPIYYKMPFRWKRTHLSEAEQILWYMDFTETFARAFGEVYPDRWKEVDADELFKSLPQHNEKAHKWYRQKEEAYEIYDSLR